MPAILLTVKAGSFEHMSAQTNSRIWKEDHA